MSDLPDRIPSAHEPLLEQNKTVQQLLDDTMRGVTVGARPWSISTDNSGESQWQRFFSSQTELLRKRELEADSDVAKARANVQLHQLKLLDELGVADRSEFLKGLRDNEKLFAEIEQAYAKQTSAFRAGYVPALVEIQHSVIKQSNKINQKALSLEVESIRAASLASNGKSTSVILDKALDDARVAMAAPFIERVRLAAMLLNQTKVYQAERALADAVNIVIPSEAMSSPQVSSLMRSASAQLKELKVQNRLLELYDANLQKLDLNPQDGVLSPSELDAAKSRGADPELQDLAKFLSDNYKYLTRNHFTLFGKNGISRADIIRYEKERASKINDLRF